MDIRNIAIIAHVDHGKTTLVDALLHQSGLYRENQQVAERIMDSNDLERERGITILAKCASVEWKGVRINIVDTPGHADFGGEVERILSMVDGVLLLVDASEGPMPQTKFVTQKALGLGLKPIVVVNKIDKANARPTAVHDEVFDLFAVLDADEEQLDFPILFASAKEGWASEDSDVRGDDMACLFDKVVDCVPGPDVDADGPFRMLVTTLESDPYLDRVLTGRIQSGSLTANTTVQALNRDGGMVEKARVTKVQVFRGPARTEVETAAAGDIVSIAGFPAATVTDTLCGLDVTEPIPAEPVDPPTLAMVFSINDSPMAGRDGDKVTSRVIRARLMAENAARAEEYRTIFGTEPDNDYPDCQTNLGAWILPALIWVVAIYFVYIVKAWGLPIVTVAILVTLYTLASSAAWYFDLTDNKYLTTSIGTVEDGMRNFSAGVIGARNAIIQESNSIFGQFLNITVNIVFPYVVLGALFGASAGGQSLIKLAVVMTRKLRGGPAHAAIVGSATFGTISGGPVVNVLGTGTLTIPMMIL